MSTRLVNFTLFVDTLVLLASGSLLFATNRREDAWLFSLHRYAGTVFIAVLVPKTRIVVRSLARKWSRRVGLDLTTVAGIALTGLLVLSLGLALAWTLSLLPFYVNVLLYVTPLGLHWYLAFALVPLFAWHSWKRWKPLPRLVGATPAGFKSVAVSRRTAMRLLGIGAMGLFGLGAIDFLAATTDWTRRFTGSRLVDSFEGNILPVTSSDGPPVIDISTWRLRITGRVARPLELGYADLVARGSSTFGATLDCTLGWASTQNWHGVMVSDILVSASASGDARQVTCRSATGAYAVLSIDEAKQALIATHVGAERLSDAHGFPARLVAPTRRGYHWIKWMTELVVS